MIKPTLKRINFAGPENDLMQVTAGGNVEEALELAANLTLGVERLCQRLDFSISNNEDPVEAVELRALAFLAGASASLIQSVRYGMKAQEEVGQ
ncbi:hypothetical protein ABQX22_18360 [Xanthomonas sp. WHRI 1810A]|uniref:hypothetical protein n=1 Tax=Xanthomonas sp. WHRI 1810A TaxID=3161565 RepID=UPI0032E8D2BF